MSRKSWAIGLILVIAVGTVSTYFLTDGFNSMPQLDGSVTFKVLQNGSYLGVFNQQIGDYKYCFAYYPSTVSTSPYLNTPGQLIIWRQDEQGAPSFPLTINAPQEHLGMTFTIKEVKPDYVVVNAKPIQ